MFGFGGKKQRVPQRWLEAARDGVFKDGQRIGAVMKKDTYPYARLIMDGDRKEVLWHAPNYLVAGNRLVTVEFDAAGKDPDGVPAVRSRVEALFADLAVWRLELSPGTWLVGTETEATELHRLVGDTIGIEHHSYFVVDLMDGRGMGWNAPDGVMTELEPAKPDNSATASIDHPSKLGGLLSCIGVRGQEGLRKWIGTEREHYLGSDRISVRDRTTGEVKTETVVGYGFPRADVGATSLFIMQPDGRAMDFISFAPAAYVGVPHSMTLEGIDEDENGLDARLTVRLEGGQRLTFWDTEYFRNKNRYALGTQYEFALAALAFHLEAAQRGAPYFSPYVGLAADCARVSLPVATATTITVEGNTFHKFRATLLMVGDQPIDLTVFGLAANLRGQAPIAGGGLAGDLCLQGFLVESKSE